MSSNTDDISNTVGIYNSSPKNKTIDNITNVLQKTVVYSALVWVVSVFLIDVSILALQYGGNEKLAYSLVSGDFQSKEIWVDQVTNNVKMGNLAGNRNLEFGLKNVLEEFLQENDWVLNDKAKTRLKVEVVFLDVITTKQNISLMHKSQEEVVIRLRGTLYENGKKIKSEIVEESSSEISMSAIVIDEGGKFNQQSLSSALKKGCNKLINKLVN